MGNYLGKAQSWWPSVVKKTQGPKKLSIQTKAAFRNPDRKFQRIGEPSGTKGHFTSIPQRHDPLQLPGISSVEEVLPFLAARWPKFGKKKVIRTCLKQKSVTINITRPDHNTSRKTSGTNGPFTITPQRHYPLQQPGTSSTGVLLPVRLDGFGKKHILTPRNKRNCIRIARPDHNFASMVYQRYAAVPEALEDRCSKKSRKRELDDVDMSFTAEQRSKKRCSDSEGSYHSAFESLLPNRASSLPDPNPTDSEGNAHSANSAPITSGARVNRGTNAIASSYSSSHGLKQFQLYRPPRSLASPSPSRSPSPASSRSPSPASSRSPSPASSRSPSPAPSLSQLAESTSGARKRKIQLVPRRNEPIFLPPAPELGYTVTAKDLDEEKSARFTEIQELLGWTPGSRNEEALPHKVVLDVSIH
ncbi:nuclear envelope pore membrane protein POM 121-like isoform X2 [Festucalex cinctus]